MIRKHVAQAILLLLALPTAVLAKDVGGNAESLNRALAKQVGITEAQAQQQVDGVFRALQSELAAGNVVAIKKFGKFFVADRQARKARNPRTGQVVDVPAKKYPRFVASDSLKESVNQRPQQ